MRGAKHMLNEQENQIMEKLYADIQYYDKGDEGNLYKVFFIVLMETGHIENAERMVRIYGEIKKKSSTL